MANSSHTSNAVRGPLVADADNLNERGWRAGRALARHSHPAWSCGRRHATGLEQNCLSHLVMKLQQGGTLKAIDRVMAADSRTHQLTEEQARQVRQELSAFIEDLLAWKRA